jgi:hypothetical protein
MVYLSEADFEVSEQNNFLQNMVVNPMPNTQLAGPEYLS